MRLSDVIQAIGARVVMAGAPVEGVEVEGYYAGDRISDLLNHATERRLLVTRLAGPQVLRVGELMGVPAICMVDGATPEPEQVKTAAQHGYETALLVSPHGMAETCRLLDGCLGRQGGPP